MHIPNQKFHSTQIPILRDITEIWRKSTILSMIYQVIVIMHNNNVENNNKIIMIMSSYRFFISNQFIDFSESIWIFPIVFYVFENTIFEKKNQGMQIH